MWAASSSTGSPITSRGRRSLQIHVVTLFPGLVEQVLRFGVTGRAAQTGLLSLRTWNPRDFAQDRHRTVDDRPYGGGPGMVMAVEPLRSAIRAAREAAGGAPVVLMSPQGTPLTQARLNVWSRRPSLVLVAGRYEGIDERLVALEIDEECSIGDYVLSGGELPAMVVIDALARLQPGVLGHEDSARSDSFMNGLLDCPHYTRPEVVDGLEVPPVLRSGDHGAIRRWRLKQALGRTCLRRPDLLRQRGLSREERMLLREYLSEHGLDEALCSEAPERREGETS